MFQPGQMVMYGRSGVCKVVDIGPLSGADAQRLYYTLQPVFATETIYAPVEGKVYMRPVMTAVQARELVDCAAGLEEDVCSERNLGLLREHYEEAFASHDNLELMRLIKSVYLKNRQATENGRKPGQLDQQYMKRAESMLHGELAVALNIPLETVGDYIKNAVEEEVAI